MIAVQQVHDETHSFTRYKEFYSLLTQAFKKISEIERQKNINSTKDETKKYANRKFHRKIQSEKRFSEFI